MLAVAGVLRTGVAVFLQEVGHRFPVHYCDTAVPKECMEQVAFVAKLIALVREQLAIDPALRITRESLKEFVPRVQEALEADTAKRSQVIRAKLAINENRAILGLPREYDVSAADCALVKSSTEDLREALRQARAEIKVLQAELAKRKSLRLQEAQRKRHRVEDEESSADEAAEVQEVRNA